MATARQRKAAATPDDNRGGEPGSRENGLRAAIESATAGFRAAIDDDLNSAGALGQVFTLIRELNSTLDTFAPGQASGETSQAVAAALAWLRDVDKLWAILPQDDELARIELQVDGRLLVGTGPRLEPALLDKIVERTQARAARDFENADRLRDGVDGRRDRGRGHASGAALEALVVDRGVDSTRPLEEPRASMSIQQGYGHEPTSRLASSLRARH